MVTISLQGFKRYFANTSWMMAEKIVRMAVAFVVGIYVARYLGPGRFGLLSYAMSFVALFASVATLGLDGIVVRNLVQSLDERDVLLGTAFTLKAAGGIVLIGFVSLAIQFTSSDKLTKILVLIIAGGMLLQSFNVIDFYFQSQVRAKFTSYALFYSLVVSSAAKIMLIAIQASLVWFAWVYVLENAILAVALIFVLHRQQLTVRSWHFQKRVAGLLLHDSWPLMLSGLAIMVYMRIDQVMIKEMMTNEAVGNYAIAVKLSEAWYFIPMAVSSSLFPAIINARDVSKEFYYDRLQKLYDLMVWTAIAIALPMTFIAGPLVYYLFGAPYADAGPVLTIHIWAGVFVFFGVARGKWLLAENLQKLSFQYILFGAVTNVIANYMLIPAYGIKGAAWSTLLSQFIVAYGAPLFHRQVRISCRMFHRSLFPIHIVTSSAIKHD